MQTDKDTFGYMSPELAKRQQENILNAFEKLPAITDEYVQGKLDAMNEKLEELRGNKQ